MSDAIEWINRKIINEGEKIEPNDVEEIRDFTLLWNLFENICCNKFAKIDEINNLIDSKIDNFDENNEIFTETFEYFYQRYQDKYRFIALNFNNKAMEKLASKILSDTYTDKNNKLKFIMSVIYRYRNNLFHGEKQMRYIRLQKENFKIANKFLMYFIEQCKG